MPVSGQRWVSQLYKQQVTAINQDLEEAAGKLKEDGSGCVYQSDVLWENNQSQDKYIKCKNIPEQ